MTTHTPPKGVQEAAQRARRWIEEGKAGDNFTDVGRTRATQLAKGDDVSDDIVKRMRDYFSRHAKDAEAQGFTHGDDGYPSAGRVAWDAWGGDAGRRWVDNLDDD